VLGDLIMDAAGDGREIEGLCIHSEQDGGPLVVVVVVVLVVAAKAKGHHSCERPERDSRKPPQPMTTPRREMLQGVYTQFCNTSAQESGAKIGEISTTANPFISISCSFV